MKTKLQSLDAFTQAAEDQDGIGLILLVRNVYHNKDQVYQSMLDLVRADKVLHICWQHPQWSCVDYMREFKARIQIAESVGSIPGECDAATEIILTMQGIPNISNVRDSKIKAAAAKGAKQYLVAMLFEGLNANKYQLLKTAVHNAWVLGENRIPRDFAAVMRLADTYVPPKAAQATGSGQGYTCGAAFMQQGEEKDPRTACDRKEVACFHCKGDHHLNDCLDITKEQKKKIWDEVEEKWRQQNLDVQAHIKMGIEENEEEAFAFPQKDYDDPRVVKERERQTLNEDFMYLDSTSIFHQMFADKNILDVEKVAIRLRGECNAGTTHSNEKWWFKDLFHMWLVRNGITNLLSLPRLE